MSTTTETRPRAASPPAHGKASATANGRPDQRQGLHPGQRHPVHRGRGLPGRPDRTHHCAVVAADRDVRPGAGARRLRRRRPYPRVDHQPRPRLHRPGARADRRAADRRAADAARSCPTAACGWWRTASPPTATPWTRPSGRSSPGTARPTTTACSTPTRPMSWPPAARTSSPACPTPTAAAGSSATTAGCRCTASTGWSPPSRPRRPPWTPPVHRRGHPRPRGARRADPRARRAHRDGRLLRLRRQPPRPRPPRRRSSGCTWPTSPR